MNVRRCQDLSRHQIHRCFAGMRGERPAERTAGRQPRRRALLTATSGGSWPFMCVCVCVCEHSVISCVHSINIRGAEDLCVNERKALVTEETFFFLLKGKPQLWTFARHTGNTRSEGTWSVTSRSALYNTRLTTSYKTQYYLRRSTVLFTASAFQRQQSVWKVDHQLRLYLHKLSL